MSLRKTAVFSFITLILSACSSGGSEDNPLAVDPTIDPPTAVSNVQKDIDILFGYLKSEYFWNDTLPSEIDNTAWDSVPDAMEALKGPEDQFSWVATNAEYAEWANSMFFGYGFDSKATENNDGLILRYTLEGSSAYEAGMRRGDIITHLGGSSVVEALSNGTLESLLGPMEAGYQLQVKYVKPNGNEVEAQIEKSSRPVKSVFTTQVKDISINDASTKLGYLVFNSFVNNSEAELNTAFGDFASAGVEELILDLRYNSGGFVTIAQQLAQHIGGTNLDNHVFAKYVHNDLQASKDITYYFNQHNQERNLNLNRVVVLTSSETCSASELVVNSLNPFIEVILIGEETCGKPYGMYFKQIGAWSVSAVNFQVFNAVDESNYTDGFTPDCFVQETYPGDWGVESEALLAEAIHYLKNDSCLTPVSVQQHIKTSSKKADLPHGFIKTKSVI